MNFFWIDPENQVKITYEELLNLILEDGINNIYIKNKNPFLVFLNLLRNFLNNRISVLLDSDFTEKEMLDLGICKKTLKKGKYQQKIKNKSINSTEDLIGFFEKNKKSISVEIFTSGTTGRPKKIIQNYSNLTRAVKINNRTNENIWAFAYNPTHFAGLQVFFQAFYNLNEIVYVFESDYKKVFDIIVERNITNLSCTPTYFKMLLAHITMPIKSLKSLTFGGEKFNLALSKKIKLKFPNAKVNNIYASTEAGSLLRSDDDFFTIPEKYINYIKIVDNELLIHHQILGQSDSLKLEGEWYRTGDIVQLTDEKKFKIIGRKSEMINVGGYKVNPDEIERVIRNIKGVKDVYVSGRKNSITGNIVIATIIKDNGVDEVLLKKIIKKEAKSQLQEFKNPRIIKFVDSFDLTRTGKIKKI